MSWTTELPIESGIYAWRMPMGRNVIIANVINQGGYSTVKLSNMTSDYINVKTVEPSEWLRIPE